MDFRNRGRGDQQDIVGHSQPGSSNSSTATAEAPARRKLEMETRQEPAFFRFETPGAYLGGILLKLERIMLDGKSVARATVLEEETGKPVSFLPTYQLIQKLRWPDDRGKLVQITFKGKDPGVVRNGNAMHVFDVQVSKERAHLEADGAFQATDEDIPF